MAESLGKTIRFPRDLLNAIQRCADAREISFSEVVVETCEAKYAEHSLASRVTKLERQVSDIETRLESNADYECEQKYKQ
jgi:polyhydroxyalkanoate synthesis regulator phasin